MIFVEGGTFTMGSNEGPTHQVALSDYYIGKNQVTQADWRSIMGNNPSKFKGCDECPVESVSWNDIQDFLKKLNAKYPGKNYRLPTEAEWEYAARGGLNSKGFWFSGGNNLNEVAWHAGNSGSKTHPVGTRKANELGLYDMNGNVWEWCWGWKDAYPSNSHRVLRGGSWYDAPRHFCVSYRHYIDPDNREDDVGFRVVASSL